MDIYLTIQKLDFEVDYASSYFFKHVQTCPAKSTIQRTDFEKKFATMSMSVEN